MPDPLIVFIGHDYRWPTVTRVAEYSLRHFASAPIDVRLLDPLALPTHPGGSRTQFSMLRFLIPHLMGYKGRALYVDQDVLFLDDVAKLFAEATGDVACVQHDYASSVRRPNWVSVMVLECSKLTAWTLDAWRAGPRERFHELRDVVNIGALHPRWNRLDYLHEDTGILHYTSGTPVDAGKRGERLHGASEFALWREWEKRATA